jgi:hypothetical protein
MKKIAKKISRRKSKKTVARSGKRLIKRERFSARRKVFTRKTKHEKRKVKSPKRKHQKALAQKKVKSRGFKFALNTNFSFLNELRSLVLKSSPDEKRDLTERINKIGRIKFAAIAGVFMNKESQDPSLADLLIVGDDIEPRKLRGFLKSLEADIGREVKYAVMEKDEFTYRLSMFDRFIRVLLESPHEKLINKLGL